MIEWKYLKTVTELSDEHTQQELYNGMKNRVTVSVLTTVLASTWG
jgi:hypothetical protein